MNDVGYNPKAGSKHAGIVVATVANTKSETGCIIILLINKAIKMKGLDHHLLCPIKCHMNGVMINEVLEFLIAVPCETMHAIQLENSFDVTHPIIFPLKIIGVACYFEVRTPNQEEHED